MTKGFTLIEIVVVMAIIAILAGILVPITFRSLESAEVNDTLHKLQLLKKAMVGDPQLIQNGVRTDFGFVGDIGALPADIPNTSFPGEMTVSRELVDKESSKLVYSNWQGPYLLEDEPGASTMDSWGKQFIYTVDPPDLQGRRVSATLSSAGLDRKPETTNDNIMVSIDKTEVTPAKSLQATLNFIGTSPFSGLNCYTQVLISYYAPSPYEPDRKTAVTPCIKLDSCSGGSFNVGFKDDADNELHLPVGSLLITPKIYKDENCTGSEEGKFDATALYVNDRMSTIPFIFSRAY